MITKVFDISGKEIDNIELPAVFETPYMPEVIHRVFVHTSSGQFQHQGRYPDAGEVVSAESRNTGQGIARIARARGEGFQRAGQAAGVGGIRHGRVAHPPMSWKKIEKKINKKEKLLGFCSAIGATSRKDLVEERGHKISTIESLPIVVSNEIEDITKTSRLKEILISLGLGEDLKRSEKIVRVRSGKSRMRGRKRTTALSCIIVVTKGSPICKLTSLQGVDIKPVDDMNILDLVPGSKPIRLTIYSKGALEKLSALECTSIRIQKLVIRD
jgi:large subunit ribosomal protein L4e